VREVSDEQMKGGRYRRGDMIGQSGLERLLDEHLRGRDGGERIEVDALGRPVQIMRREEPDPGAQVITTIDRRIQEAAERAMAGKAGSVVVMDPRNGDVLALTSSPAFPLDRLTGNLDRDEWVRLVRDPMSPLMNRALQGLYPPASVFKIIVAAAGLQEGSLAPMDHIYCNGEFTLGNWTFKDWKPGGHGHVDLHQSIAQSCDIFFYQAGLKVGGDMMAKYAQAFGLGSPTGIDLGGERFGLVVLDPPPFTRRKDAVEAAARGYKEINIRGLRLLERGGRLVTFSCSHHVTPAMFEEICRQAAGDAGIRTRVLATLTQSRDHPIILTIPESRYLTGLLLESA